jgi:hypothetical protein
MQTPLLAAHGLPCVHARCSCRPYIRLPEGVAADSVTDVGGPGQFPKGKLFVNGFFSRVLRVLQQLPPIVSQPATSSRLGALPPSAGPVQTFGFASSTSPDAFLARDPAVVLATYLRRECPEYFSEASRDLIVADRTLDTAARNTSDTARAQLAQSAQTAALHAVSVMDSASLANALKPAGASQLEKVCTHFVALGKPMAAASIICMAAATIAGDNLAVEQLSEDVDKQYSEADTVATMCWKN